MLFITFILAPAGLADAAVRERLDRGRTHWLAAVAWVKELRAAGFRWDHQWYGRSDDLRGAWPFRQLRSGLFRGFVFCIEMPGRMQSAVRAHYRQPSARTMTPPAMLTVRGMAPPWY